MVAFKHPGKLHLLKPPGNEPVGEGLHEHQPDTPCLVFGDHVGADRPQPLDGLLVPEQPQEAEGEEPAVDRLDSGVVVEQAENGAHGLTVDLRHEGEFRCDQKLEARRHVVDLVLGERHEAPRAPQALVVDLKEHPHFLGKPAAVEWPDGDAKPFLHSRHHRRELGVERAEHRHRTPEGVHVLDLPEAGVLNEMRVPRPVVGHHEEWRRIEALDEQTTLVVEAGIRWAANACHPLGMQPVACRLKERA